MDFLGKVVGWCVIGIVVLLFGVALNAAFVAS